MRRILALAFLIIAGIVGTFAYRTFEAGPPVVLPAPTGLKVSVAGAQLQPNGWSNSPAVQLKIENPAISSGADLEIRPAGVRFDGSPTSTVAVSGRVAAACRDCVANGTDSTQVRLSDGAYHWQARFHNSRGVSPWMPYAGLLRIDSTPPTITHVASATDPNPAATYHSSTLKFGWVGVDRGSGVDGYSYLLDQSKQGTARAELRTRSTVVTLQGLNTGTWYFHVRVLDRAGNWGATSTFPVRIDVTPPGLAGVNFSTFQFDPKYQPLKVSFSVTRAASEVRVGVYRQSDQHLVRLYRLTGLAKGNQSNVTWDGKDAGGQYVPPGLYEVYIRATDAYGHSSLTGWRDFAIDYKRIVVSLSQQKLWAYDGNSLFLTSLVTTGNQALPTPQGTFYIQGKFHPFTFHSPWPKSSPYWYAPSPVSYAMLFQAGGYFIHDAPWRTAFGPGTNAQVGTPGTNYTGTHGCINVPLNVARSLFGWTEIGTVVQVVP